MKQWLALAVHTGNTGAGVIGGADGPTAVFLTAGSGPLAAVAVLAVAICLFLLIRKNK